MRLFIRPPQYGVLAVVVSTVVIYPEECEPGLSPNYSTSCLCNSSTYPSAPGSGICAYCGDGILNGAEQETGLGCSNCVCQFPSYSKSCSLTCGCCGDRPRYRNSAGGPGCSAAFIPIDPTIPRFVPFAVMEFVVVMESGTVSLSSVLALLVAMARALVLSALPGGIFNPM